MSLDLTTGSSFAFGNFADLRSFETEVAMQVKPELDELAWKRRDDIATQLKPPAFFGSIPEMVLTVVDDPYSVLATADKVQTQNGGASKVSTAFKAVDA